MTHGMTHGIGWHNILGPSNGRWDDIWEMRWHMGDRVIHTR